MSPAARYLWHQRLAWLLMVYVAAIGMGIVAALDSGETRRDELFGSLMQCAVVMTCVKDSALCGRPMPYSWRMPMLPIWPIAVFWAEWRVRRWWGFLWVALHGFMLLAVLVVVQFGVWILGELL